jgi:hypothetical protein
MKIAVAATAPFGAAVLEGMANRGYDIEFLLTRPDKPQGRGRKKAAPPAKEVAKRLEIPVQQPDKLTGLPRRGARRRHRGLRGARSRRSSRRAPLAQRPSLAPAALARGRAGRAGDHGRRPENRRHDPQDDTGAGRGADRRSAPLPDRAEDDTAVVVERAAALASTSSARSSPSRRSSRSRTGHLRGEARRADRELDWSKPPEELLNQIALSRRTSAPAASSTGGAFSSGRHART